MAATTKFAVTLEQGPTPLVARQVIPVRVFGVNAKGRDFSEETYAVVEGPRIARIGLSQRVIVGEPVFVLNLATNREAEFTVLQLLSLPERDAEVLEWAARSTRPIKEVWGHTEPNLPA